MRFNVRQAKTLLWVLNLTAVVLVGYTFYGIYMKKKAGALAPKSPEEWKKLMRSEDRSEASPTDAQRAPLKDFSAVWSYDVTGKETAVASTLAADKAAATPPPAAVKPIEEVLEVKQIFAPSGAVVNYKADSSALENLSQKLLSVGSVLKTPYDAEPYNGKVLNITADAVEFQWGKDKSQVKIKRTGPGQRVAPLATGAVADSQQQSILSRFQEPPETTTQAAPNHYVLSAEDQQNFSSNYETLLAAEAKITPIPGKDRKTQLKLELKKTDGRLAEFGFESGDVLISINGQAVSTKAQAINYVRNNSNMPSYTVVIDRRGNKISKTIYAPKKKGG
jgi:hypothetical protein